MDSTDAESTAAPNGVANGKSVSSYVNHGFDNHLENTESTNRTEINGNGVISVKPIQIEEDTDEQNRPQWSNGLEFLMSCISMSVGLGNIWRFPFTAYENGGGAFLIPYIVVLIIIGRPMYYLEMAIGQFTSRSSIKAWNVVPLLKGVGIGQMIGTLCVVTYYVSLIALTLSYMFSSFTAELPWAKCLESWGENCVDSDRISKSSNVTNTSVRAVSSSEIYFLRVVLNEKSNITDGIGAPDWKLTLWLLLAWVCVFLVIVRGVKSSGKAAYFLALFPYVVMIILLIRALTLDGAVDGIIFFIKPQWGELLNPKVWYSATTQLFFSLSVGMGTIIMFSSYNNFSHNIYRDAMIVTTLDTFTSLLAGMTIFSILGNLAYNLGVDDISDVVKSGTALAFISYPDAIAKFEFIPQVFSVLFFFMLFVLGVGSAVALQSAIITVVWDEFPTIKYWKLALGLSVGGFLIGLIYVTPGGQWMLNLVDHYGGTFLIYTLAIIEMMGIFWIYGLENFCHDIEFMTNRHVTIYWRLCWTVITPGFMLIVFVYSLIKYEWPTYSDAEYPTSGLVGGVLLFSLGVVQLFVWAIWLLYRNAQQKSFWDVIKEECRPNEEWGPKSSIDRKRWIIYKTEAKNKRIEIAASKGHTAFQQKIWILFGRYKDNLSNDAP